MSDVRRTHGVADRVLDAVLYAPIGALDMLLRDGPRAVADGRTKVEQQVRTARWIGEMAVTVGRRKAAERWDGITAAVRRPQAPPASDHAERTPAPAAHAPAPQAAQPEPFDGYDSLPASELVPLLARLDASELDAVRAYEVATRGRRTVLAKIDQLLDGR